MNECMSPSRRALLSAAAACAAGALPIGSTSAAPINSAASDPWRGLKIGMASYSFRKLPLEACIKAVARLDLHYVSIKDMHLPMNSTPEQRKEVAQKFREAGVTPISCGVVTIKNDQANARNAFEYARDIGVPTIVCDPDPNALSMLDQLVKEYEIKLAIHNHGPEAKHFKSPYDSWQAVQGHDPRIGLCIDVGHTARAGVDPAEAIRKCSARLYDLHFKDITAGGRRGGSPIEVGRGRLDIPAMLRALLEIHYGGHVGFEYEKDADDPIPGAAESVGYTRGVLREMAVK